MKIDGLQIKVIRKNIKNLYIKVYPPHGEVRLTCPQQLSDQAIYQFAAAKTDWIKRKQTKVQAQPSKTDYQYISGESHYFKGDLYTLKVIYNQAKPQVIVTDYSAVKQRSLLSPLVNQSQLNLYVRYGSISEQREQVLLSWYRQQLKAELTRLVAKWSAIIGVQVNDWGVKRMKTRWGTCNVQARRIWLNLELIKRPQHCLEYVVVHELVHLLERKHNARFWSYMTQFVPNWQQYQKELNQHFTV